MVPSIAVASEVLSYCTSCKMDLNHVVVALKGEKIAKVECQTCKKIHVFRAPKGQLEPKRSKKAEAAYEGSQALEVEWEKLMNSHRDAPMKPYSMKSQFSLGDKLSHTKFGDGIVGKLIYPNKLEVIFRTDIKVLIHAGSTD